MLTGHSSYSFAVGLFALWHTGRVAVLPPNHQPESLAETAMGIRGIVTDMAYKAGKFPQINPLALVARRRNWPKLRALTPCLELFTSGSTGDRKVVLKTLAQLQNEVSVLEKTFGERLRRCHIYSTIPPHHLYGLLFRLLWPLSAARPFADDTALLWQELTPSLLRSPPSCLISSPTHLERMSLRGNNALRNARPRLIFSSGGPLQESAVKRIRQTWGQAPIEVYGSTETGGVGWRQRQIIPGSDHWVPFQGVILSQKGAQERRRLRVSSPFVGMPETSFLMGDLGIVYKDGTFRLDGRADRIIKIAEKRLSLDDMERRLAKHPWVREAKIVLLKSTPLVSRVTLGAVVILHSPARSELKSAGRAVMARAFRNHLRKSFDDSTLPRSFRFVDEMPRTPQGKLSQAVLANLFHKRFDPSRTTPQRLSIAVKTTSLRLRLLVPRELAYFEGHFPGYSVVPGVVQLRWVVQAAEEWLGRRITVRRMEAIKFKNVLRPGALFLLTLNKEHSGGERVLQFALMGKARLYSSGRLVLSL